MYTYRYDGYYYNNGTYPAGGTAVSTGAITETKGFALDMDNKTLTVSGSLGSFTITGLVAGTFYPLVYLNGSGVTTNFGASAFKYTVPTGYNAGVFN
jgi:hypothetical protein